MIMEKILLVDDDPNITFALNKALLNADREIIILNSGEKVLETVKEENPSIIFLDIAMPGVDGLTVLQSINEADFEVPVVVMTAFGDMETAVKAMKLGAFEYLTKPLDIHRIRAITKTILEIHQLKTELNHLRQKVSQPRDKYQLVGKSPAMYRLYKTIGTIASSPNSTNVLILGESGTGKELVARAIHGFGEYNKRPFVGLNCTVLPEQLLMSELFGHEKGSFTGAVDRKIGKFEAVGEGTIYLDEIGDTSLEFQKKLLRVLQEREFERLGGLTSIPLRARIIASTNRDLQYKIRSNEFREDLYFRLSVLEITVPPLRERKEDIPLLIGHFLDKYSLLAGDRIKELSSEALDLLAEYDFPGNVRELENLVEKFMFLERGTVIQADVVGKFLTSNNDNRNNNLPIISNNLGEARKYILDLFEKNFIEKLLKEKSGNVTAAAQEAGIERQSFQRLMKKHNILSEDFRGVT
jgi:DNA-binding NtrC family response regulator